MPFNRLKIKIKKEIVTFDGSQLDVENHSGKHVVSNEWNTLIEDKKTIVIDVRNNFEVEKQVAESAPIDEIKMDDLSEEQMDIKKKV